jgi:aspartyl-tRNA(Asn)/glutamyl-tRNA(Gln) amidotransferase subunit B
MNSFNFAARGIDNEVARQIKIYEAGGTVEQQTLHFDPGNEDSPPLRSKEEAQDYRYFAEPDLVPIEPPQALVEELRSSIGELPAERIGRIAETLSFYDADVLVTGGLDRLWSAIVAAGADVKESANVLANAFVAAGVEPERVDPGELAKLVSARAQIPRAAFDEALARSGDEGFSAAPYLLQKAVSEIAELDPVIDAVIADNAGQAAQYRGGKEGLLGFFVGQVMRQTGGKADPRVVSDRVKQKLRG